MAHKTQMDFVRRTRTRFPKHFSGCKVLEIGSLIIAGSVRDLFTGCQYEGCDLGEGAGVDVVCPAHRLEGRDGMYDTVISCEALEHDQYWVETIKAAVRMLRPGGLLVLTWAGPGRAVHGTHGHTPQDAPFTNDYYYDPLTSDIVGIVGHHMHEVGTEQSKGDRYLWGVKS